MKKKKMVYTALGLPIVLVGFRFKKIRGIEVPDVNLNTLQKVVFEALIEKPTNLTGAEVRFIRSYLRFSQTELSKILNQAGHSIVSQWEKKGVKATGMDCNTEILLRLHMAKTLSRAGFAEYAESCLEESPFETKPKPEPIEIDYRSAA